MIKNWEHLTLEDQKKRMVQVSELLKKHDLDNIRPYMIDQVVYQIHKKDPKRLKLLLIIGNIPIEKEKNVKLFTKEANDTVLKGLSNRTAIIQIESKLQPGDKYKTISDVVDIVTYDEEKIEHQKGEVILIDFWATWCGPCQGPMAHNQHMLEKNKDRWKDKVRIIGVSVDNDIEGVKKHVNKNNWKLIEHYFIGASQSRDDYQVKGIPHVVLIDTKGNIAFIGHPQMRDLEADIEKLLKGELLTEIKTPRLQINEAQFKELDLQQIRKEMDLFQTEVKSLSNDSETMKFAKTMESDYVISTQKTYYDPEQSQFLTHYNNTNVLSGTIKSVELTKQAVEKFLNNFKGTFQTEFKTSTHPMENPKL